SEGPDVTISRINGIHSWGSEDLEENGNFIAAFSVGTTSCNIGDTALEWLAFTNAHPVIRANMYRLHDNRFEQVGTSWSLHGFLALNNSSLCTDKCVNPNVAPHDELRPGCSHPESASFQGSRTYLAPNSDINAHTGVFPYPPTLPTADGNTGVGNRLQVHHDDLDPELNDGARYFVEGHCITLDDAQAGNGNNNASYREIDIITSEAAFCGVDYCALIAGDNFGEQAAIRAWKAADNSVRETDAQVPGEGLFILAAKVTDLDNGFWQYEYALHNLNSDRSGGSFTVPIPEGAVIQNISFHDVDHHSGEPWDGTDWEATVKDGQLTWCTTPYDVDEDANALRWSTLYNFRFQMNGPAADGLITLGLFKPGVPEEIAIRTKAPELPFLDCNENGIADHFERDRDGDNLIDECDACPDSIQSQTIAIGTCDTGVLNTIFDDGCTMADVLAECDASRRNQGDYVTCTKETALAWKHDGLITGSEFADIVACAAKSNAGRSTRPERTVGKLTTQGKE
ncbi:MAG: hypothetical protein IID35_10315, partial [Planctomycetes bacterium]|nr:hypothetical protein [Planctomycetota bacterium]